MRIRRIDSDALLGAAYDAERSVLTVQFESGSIYEYFDVEPELYAELEAAQPHPWRVVERVKETGTGGPPEHCKGTAPLVRYSCDQIRAALRVHRIGPNRLGSRCCPAAPENSVLAP